MQMDGPVGRCIIKRYIGMALKLVWFVGNGSLNMEDSRCVDVVNVYGESEWMYYCHVCQLLVPEA